MILFFAQHYRTDECVRRATLTHGITQGPRFKAADRGTPVSLTGNRAGKTARQRPEEPGLGEAPSAPLAFRCLGFSREDLQVRSGNTILLLTPKAKGAQTLKSDSWLLSQFCY